MQPQARFIWCEDSGSGRNDYALFHFPFKLTTTVRRARFALFADTRYRLMVNGRTVGHGPARFKRGYPEYDEWDLLPYLHEGQNAIAVMVASLGKGTFLSDPGPGGFIGWGEVRLKNQRVIQLETGPAWRALASPGHDPLTPYLSFAVGPGESCDLRRMPTGWESAEFDSSDWPTAIEVPDPSWGKLERRSIPMLDERFTAVESCKKLFTIAKEPGLNTFGIRIPGFYRTDGWVAMATWIQSPKAQTVELLWSGGDLQLNGELVKRHAHPNAPMRSGFQAKILKGWNRLVAFHVYRNDLMEAGLAWPEDAGLTFHQAPKPSAKSGWLTTSPVAGPVETAQTAFRASTKGALPDLGAAWKSLPKAWQGVTPMLQRGWAVLEKGELPPHAEVFDQPALCSPHTSQASVVLLFDFGGEVLGRPLIELTAPAGTIIDLTYTERLYHGQAEPWFQGTRMVERFVSRSGRQTIHAFHPRGMRYLEVIIHGPKQGITLHRVGVTRALYPVEPGGAFACSDPRLNRIWELGRVTQAVCMEDAYLDCPWRERGIYNGDILVQFATNLACFGDHALMRRCIELLFFTQDETGMLAPCSHGLPAGRHPDYTAITVRCLREYWARTGDLTFVKKMKSRLVKLLRGLKKRQEPGLHLMNGDGHVPYIDSGRNGKSGISCGLNCLMQMAFSDAAHLLTLLGDTTKAAAAEAEARAIASAIREAFLNPATGLFTDQRLVDDADAAPSSVGNTLALLQDIALERREPLEFVLGQMKENFPDGPPARTRDYHISPYFSYFVLDLCRREQCEEEAVAYIRRYWSHMLDHGAWTTWEFFAPICSLCHAWSSSPTHHLTQQILGVWYAADGDPAIVRLAPSPPDGIDWAEGVFPHPDGPIAIRWDRQGEAIRLVYDAPSSVHILAE